MAVTPFIRPIVNNRGTYYTFQTAIDDVQSTFNQTGKKFKFSHYVLLNIPTIGTPSDPSKQNKMQLPAVGETPIEIGIDGTDFNLNLAESFENYCLNLESCLVNLPTYRPSLMRTPAERVFWKWLKETGAIRFRQANDINERDASALGSVPRYVEEDDADGGYSKVVKYVSEIDIVNSIRNKNSYTEVFIYVPSNTGSTPRIMFGTVADDNYKPNMLIQNLSPDPLDLSYLSGRTRYDINPYGLRTNAFYDCTGTIVNSYFSNTISNSATYSSGTWYSGNTSNSYYTDLVFTDPGNQMIERNYSGDTVIMQRNKLDGVCLDFNTGNYILANSYQNISTFSQFNGLMLNDSQDFEFNAMLVYYEVYDTVAGVSNVTTNLHGVLFLDKVESLGVGLDFAIPVIPKLMPNRIAKTNGTAFSYRLNIKLDGSSEMAMVERSINDYSTVSLDMFYNAISAITNLTESYNAHLAEFDSLSSLYAQVRDLYINDTNKTELLVRIGRIESSLAQAQALFDNSTSFAGILDDLYNKYNGIIQNRTSITVNYVLDPTTINAIVNRNQEYNFNGSYIGDLTTTPSLTLVQFTNVFKHSLTGAITAPGDINVNIDDTGIKWQNGQALKIFIDTPLMLEGSLLTFKTDKNGIVSGSAYGVTMCVLDSTDFGTAGIPAFEIVCTDSTKLTFDVNKIR
jgi:hypothetical protein